MIFIRCYYLVSNNNMFSNICAFTVALLPIKSFIIKYISCQLSYNLPDLLRPIWRSRGCHNTANAGANLLKSLNRIKINIIISSSSNKDLVYSCEPMKR